MRTNIGEPCARRYGARHPGRLENPNVIRGYTSIGVPHLAHLLLLTHVSVIELLIRCRPRQVLTLHSMKSPWDSLHSNDQPITQQPTCIHQFRTTGIAGDNVHRSRVCPWVATRKARELHRSGLPIDVSHVAKMASASSLVTGLRV